MKIDVLSFLATAAGLAMVVSGSDGGDLEQAAKNFKTILRNIKGTAKGSDVILTKKAQENADLISDAAKLMTGAVAAIEASRSPTPNCDSIVINIGRIAQEMGPATEAFARECRVYNETMRDEIANQYSIIADAIDPFFLPFLDICNQDLIEPDAQIVTNCIRGSAGFQACTK